MKNYEFIIEDNLKKFNLELQIKDTTISQLHKLILVVSEEISKIKCEG